MHKCDHLIFHFFKNTVEVFETMRVDILLLAITEDNMAIGSHILVIYCRYINVIPVFMLQSYRHASEKYLSEIKENYGFTI